MTTLLVAYLSGLACLAVVAAQALVDTRRKPYTGRHRTDALSTMQLVDEARSARAALREDTASLFLPVFVDEAPMCPPMYPRYDHAAGAGRYAHLRVEELDAAADRDLRRQKALVAA